MVARQGIGTSEFAVLYHVSPIAIHWDILIRIERASDLMAWRCLIDPSAWFLTATEFSTEIVELPAHRLRYLDYTGTISDNRGWVTPIMRLDAEIIEHTGGTLALIAGKDDAMLHMAIQKLAGQRWTLRTIRLA